MLELNEVLLAAPGVSHADASLAYVQENKFFANLAGTTTTQQRVRIQAAADRGQRRRPRLRHDADHRCRRPGGAGST